MSRLTHSQHDELLKAIEEVHACRDLQRFPAVVVEVFTRLISSDWVSYNEVYPAMERSIALLDPPIQDFEAKFARWTEYAHEHPVINYHKETGDGSAHQIADFLSTREYHALNLYQQVYRQMKVEYQLSATILTSPDVIIAAAMSRERGRFSETSRLIANRLRPQIAQAYANLVELQHLLAMVEGLGGALEEADSAVILWSNRRVILHASRRARELLGRYFRWREGRHLPDALAEWAAARLRARTVPDSLVLESGGNRLSARLAPRPEFHFTTIVLTEEVTAIDPQRLAVLGLSPRQNEVLAWMAEGKSNAEIGLILSMNPLTVKTHVREILRKMNVENRTTATVRALEVLRSRE